MAYSGGSREDVEYRVSDLIVANQNLRKYLGESPDQTDLEGDLYDRYAQVCRENKRLSLRAAVVRADQKLSQAKEELKRAALAAGVPIPGSGPKSAEEATGIPKSRQ